MPHLVMKLWPKTVLICLRDAGEMPDTTTTYIRLTYDGDERPVTAYVQSNALAVDRVADFELMKQQPGGGCRSRRCPSMT